MIDTIALVLPQEHFFIANHDKFNPSTATLFDTRNNNLLGSRANVTYKQNPTRTELRAGIYKPRLTITKRANKNRQYNITLKIEFSIPKLLFGNNFEEVVEQQFDEVINKLNTTLKDMGVYVLSQYLMKAPVSIVHYSKNIILRDYSAPYTYLKELEKLNINQQLDTNKTDFRNGGHSFKFRANSFEVILYDKLKDLERARISDKRSEEKDNLIQLNLFTTKPKKQPFEVLRIEIRLNTRAKIKQILKKINQLIQPTFENLFSQTISKTVILMFFEKIEKLYPPILTYEANSPRQLLAHLIAQHQIKLSKALQLLGLKTIIDDIGVREFRCIAKTFGSHTWYRLNAMMKQYQPPQPHLPLQTLKQHLLSAAPVTRVDLQDNILLNSTQST